MPTRLAQDPMIHTVDAMPVPAPFDWLFALRAYVFVLHLCPQSRGRAGLEPTCLLTKSEEVKDILPFSRVSLTSQCQPHCPRRRPLKFFHYPAQDLNLQPPLNEPGSDETPRRKGQHMHL